MNQENKYFIFTLVIFGISSIVLQSMFVPLLEINVWKPDIVLIIILLISKRFGSIKGTSAAFFLGIIIDSLSTLPVGITTLPKVIAAYAAGKTKTLRLEGTLYYLWFILFIFLNELIIYFFLQFKIELSYINLIFTRVFPNTVYTTLIMFVIILFTGKYFSEDHEPYR